MPKKTKYDKLKFVESFENIISNPFFKKFEQFIDNNKLSHAYLILSENENFNKDFCKAIALKLLCEKNQPCLKCDNCKKLLAGFHPDIMLYPKGKNFAVSDSINIIENSNIKPMLANYKIFVVNNIDKSSVQAQNKLLKVVEESPKNVIFLFNSTNVNKILQTIKSRLQIFKIELSSDDELTISDEFAFCLKMLENMKSSKQILPFITQFAEKENFLLKLKSLQKIFELMLFAKENISNNNQINSLCTEFSIKAIYEILNKITEARKQFDANVSTNIITDNFLIGLLEVKYLWK